MPGRATGAKKFTLMTLGLLAEGEAHEGDNLDGVAELLGDLLGVLADGLVGVLDEGLLGEDVLLVELLRRPVAIFS